MDLQKIKQRSNLPDDIVSLLALYEEIQTKVNKTNDKDKIRLGNHCLKGIKEKLVKLGYKEEFINEFEKT